MMNSSEKLSRLEKLIQKVQNFGLDTLTEIEEILVLMYDHGPIESFTNGTNGVGFTGESLFSIKPNNSINPDYKDEIEFKFHDENCTKISMFTQKPSEFIVKENGHRPSARYLVELFGYPSKETGRKKCYSTFKSGRKNNLGWTIVVAREIQKVIAINNGEPICSWNFQELKNHLSIKHKETMFISAKVDKTKTPRTFHYNSAIHAKFSKFENFISAIEEGFVTIDLALSTKESGNVKNAGWTFKTTLKSIPYIFTEVTNYSLGKKVALDKLTLGNPNTYQLQLIKTPLHFNLGVKNIMHNGTQIARMNNYVNTIQESSKSNTIVGLPEFIRTLVDFDNTKILTKGKVFHAKGQSTLLENMADVIIAYTNANNETESSIGYNKPKNKGGRHTFHLHDLVDGTSKAIQNITNARKDKSLYDWMVEDLGITPSTYKTRNKIDTANHQKNATISTMVSTTEVSAFEHAYKKIAGKLKSGEVTSATALELINLL